MSHNDLSDTIVAISTAAGASPVAILRLSGDRAADIVRETFIPDCGQDISSARTYTVLGGRLAIPALHDSPVPATLYIMRAPYSYTREDVFELHTIGSPPILGLILQALIASGARPAGPGEFTRRAFLSGRINLAQAESVMAVVRSRSEAELRAAALQLRGVLADAIRNTMDHLADLCALVETAIDFSDQDPQVLSVPETADRLRGLTTRLDAIGRPPHRRSCDDAVTVVISGRPNVGKSSILNALLERYGGREGRSLARRALVSPIPGTTRDVLEAQVCIQGVTFRLIDTAGLPRPWLCQERGLRDANDDVEAQAVRRAASARREAEITLLVADASDSSCEEVRRLADALSGPALLVMNKTDLPASMDVSALAVSVPCVCVSALTGEGIDLLARRLAGLVLSGGVDRSASTPTANARQQDALRRAREALAAAVVHLEEGSGLELAAFEMRSALGALGEIVGDVTTEDLLDRIFAQFCIGK